MTRYILIWHIGFDSGVSRMETVNTLKYAWSQTAPQLVERRKIELKTTSAPEILDRVNEWLRSIHGKSMAKKSLSIVVISDPAWETSEERWRTSHEALSAGYSRGEEKPRFCILDYEGTFP